MPKDAYWFKHDSNARNDLKIRRLVKRYGWQGYGWWWLLVEIMREESTYSLTYTDDTFEILSAEMACPVKEAQQFIDSLLEINLLQKNGDNNLISNRLKIDMKVKDEVQEQAKLAAYKRWHPDEGESKNKVVYKGIR